MHLLLPLAGALRPMMPLEALSAVGQATQRPLGWRTNFRPWEDKRTTLPTSPLGQIDDALLLRIAAPYLGVVFGSVDGKPGPVSPSDGGGLDTAAQLSVNIFTGNAWFKDLQPGPLTVAALFGLLPRPLRWTGNLDCELVRVSWRSIFNTDRTPFVVDYERVTGNATDALPTIDELASARAAAEAWREVVGPPKPLTVYPRGYATTSRLRRVAIDIASERFGPCRLEARDVPRAASEPAFSRPWQDEPFADLPAALTSPHHAYRRQPYQPWSTPAGGRWSSRPATRAAGRSKT